MIRGTCYIQTAILLIAHSLIPSYYCSYISNISDYWRTAVCQWTGKSCQHWNQHMFQPWSFQYWEILCISDYSEVPPWLAPSRKCLEFGGPRLAETAPFTSPNLQQILQDIANILCICARYTQNLDSVGPFYHKDHGRSKLPCSGIKVEAGLVPCSQTDT